MTKILVVEDEAPLRESIIDTLMFEGYHVVEAENGMQGWEKAQAENPDLIVCDIAMPELNGYELLLKLREDPATASLPFIFLTARVDRPFMRHGMELGADDYLTKPFTHADLLAAIRARLDRHLKLKEASSRDLEQIKTEFVRHITHELRTPLVSITAVQDIVEQQLGFLSPTELQDLLRIQRSGSQRLHHLVEQTVLLTEIKVGALTAQSIADSGLPTAIWDILTTSVNLGRKFAYRNRELPVYIDDREGNATVRCRLNPLRHAFAEIISNAIAFSPEDGQVNATQWVEDGSIFVTVKDCGSGIPVEALEQVFKEFEQLDRRRQEQQGLGLGLPLARKVIEIHGGELKIDSGESGTTITVRLPEWKEPGQK
jgi:signal transduction histidine kinase